MGRAVDLFVTYRFLKLLTTPFNKTDAFKFGIIDKDGNRLKNEDGSVEVLRTPDEKGAYTILHKLIFNIKKLFAKVPGLRTKVGTYAAALFLLKEETGMEEADILKVLEDLGHNTSIDLNEEFKDLREGQHMLNHDLMESKKGTIVHLDDIEPVGQFAGVPIYKTQENIFISVNNIL